MAGQLFRSDLQNLSELRLREAGILLRAKEYAGAYHVAGFSVELALKACIAKKIRRYSFPAKDAGKAYTHSLIDLVGLAGLGTEKAGTLALALHDSTFKANWQTASKWTPEVRYVVTITRREAHDLMLSISDSTHGMLQWIRGHW